MTVVIIDAKRTPMGHFGGAYKCSTAPELAAHVIKALTKTTNEISEVILGCVLSAGLGQAPARQAALQAGLSNNTPCTTINKMCGSGLKAVLDAANIISNDPENIIIAGGMENMSRAPYLLPDSRFGYRIGNKNVHDHMMLDGLTDAYENHLSMGEIAELCAKKFNISREDQDNFAIQSINRALTATKNCHFKNEITPLIINEDEGLSHFNLDKIPQLKPSFRPDGTITAANASNISDGAAALLLTSEDRAKKNSLKPLAKIIGFQTVAQDPKWFTTAPILAIKKLLNKINWDINEVDLFEINEAFAVVALVTMKELNIPNDKVNINGGACVLGHPIGASGARILVTLLHALKQRNKKRGIAAICIGGGEAIALAVEIL